MRKLAAKIMLPLFVMFSHSCGLSPQIAIVGSWHYPPIESADGTFYPILDFNKDGTVSQNSVERKKNVANPDVRLGPRWKYIIKGKTLSIDMGSGVYKEYSMEFDLSGTELILKELPSGPSIKLKKVS